MKKKDFVRRKWLNPVNSYADGWIKYGLPSDKYSSAYFRMGDCSRSIELEFSKDKKGLKKLALLITSMEDLYEELRSGVDD